MQCNQSEQLAKLGELEAHLTGIYPNSYLGAPDHETRVAFSKENSERIRHHSETLVPNNAAAYGEDWDSSKEACARLIKSTDTLFQGFALNNGRWFPHTWLVREDGSILEPCKGICAVYVGYKLEWQERDAFLAEHAPRHQLVA